MNPSIVYVEDDTPSREVMHILLVELMGLSDVTFLEDSTDFLQRIEKSVPDIILLDIHVYPLNGFEMLSMLRQHPRFRHARVVALTASVMNEEVHQLKTAGFDGVIAKPIDMDQFPILLERILNGENVWTIVQ
ncbi:MAG: response regulator [Anaerolineae bacterium]|nr:response regulator [Anaerolineae bacterium]